jgi:hypothetical protein
MPDDVGISDFPEEDTPACPIPSQRTQPSRFPSSTGSPRPGPANQSYAPPQNSMPGWNMANMMCQAGGAGLRQVNARLCPCGGSMMQLHPVMNDAKFF